MPAATAPSRVLAHGFVYGVALGLLPAVFMSLFGFTQCPLVMMSDGYTCHDPNQGMGGWFFVIAVGIYLLDVLIMLICFCFRRVRPIAWGLLPLLFLSPPIGVFGFYAIAFSRHPTPAGLLPWLSSRVS